MLRLHKQVIFSNKNTKKGTKKKKLRNRKKNKVLEGDKQSKLSQEISISHFFFSLSLSLYLSLSLTHTHTHIPFSFFSYPTPQCKSILRIFSTGDWSNHTNSRDQSSTNTLGTRSLNPRVGEREKNLLSATFGPVIKESGGEGVLVLVMFVGEVEHREKGEAGSNKDKRWCCKGWSV